MATARENMKVLHDELARLTRQIEELLAEKRALERVLSLMNGDTFKAEALKLAPDLPRKRTPNVKILILELMELAGSAGMTSHDVINAAAERGQELSRDTVSSVLSRLKKDNALKYDGSKYYDARYAPKAAGTFDVFSKEAQEVLN